MGNEPHSTTDQLTLDHACDLQAYQHTPLQRAGAVGYRSYKHNTAEVILIEIGPHAVGLYNKAALYVCTEWMSIRM
jgi:hypothetical protein